MAAYQTVHVTTLGQLATPRARICRRCGIEMKDPRIETVVCYDCVQVERPMSKKLRQRLAKVKDGWEDLAAAS